MQHQVTIILSNSMKQNLLGFIILYCIYKSFRGQLTPLHWIPICAHNMFPYLVKVKVSLYCSTLWDPMDYTGPHEILQARILEWVAIPFTRGHSQTKNQTRVSCIEGGFLINWAIREVIVLSFLPTQMYSSCVEILHIYALLN